MLLIKVSNHCDNKKYDIFYILKIWLFTLYSKLIKNDLIEFEDPKLLKNF